MNWLLNYVRPKIRSLVEPRDVPGHLWTPCQSCGTIIARRELEDNFNVCPYCDYHMRLDSATRLRLLFDDQTYSTLELPKVPLDPIKFRDQKRYTDRIKEAQSKTGLQDALTVAYGQVNQISIVVATFDFRFMGGSMGISVGEGFLCAAGYAIENHVPFIVIPASGGARMQEGIFSLMQMPRTVIAVKKVKDAQLPYIVILTDPTTGGVTASFAMLGDIHIAEKGAQIGFAGTRVIEETIREQLPEGFQRAEYLLEHGMIDMVVERHKLRQTLTTILSLLLYSRPQHLHSSQKPTDYPRLSHNSGEVLDTSILHEDGEEDISGHA